MSRVGPSAYWLCWSVRCLSLIHISEPTRLLSISYAVFCLKKKNGSARRQITSDVHRLARVCADEIAGKQFRKGLIDADSVEDAAAMIQAQIYREWGVAIVKGRAECLLALLECTVPNASPRSKVACGKSRDQLIERANVAHCSGGFAEAVLLLSLIHI